MYAPSLHVLLLGCGRWSAVRSFLECGSGCCPSAPLVELEGVFRDLGVCPAIGQCWDVVWYSRTGICSSEWVYTCRVARRLLHCQLYAMTIRHTEGPCSCTLLPNEVYQSSVTLFRHVLLWVNYTRSRTCDWHIFKCYDSKGHQDIVLLNQA